MCFIEKNQEEVQNSFEHCNIEVVVNFFKINPVLSSDAEQVSSPLVHTSYGKLEGKIRSLKMMVQL